MGAPDEFHPDAHPDARDITGDRRYGEWGQCVATASSTGDRCRGYAQGSHGKCGNHGGSKNSGAPEGNQNAVGNDGGAPEGNRNASTHDLYTNEHAFYSDVAGDRLQALTDKIHDEWLERYRERHGDPTAGEETELFLCAVTVAKELHGESWPLQKPEEMDAGNALVDRETHYSDEGDEYYQYEPAVVQSAINQLSRRRRQWLKDLKLLPGDDGSAKEVEISGLGDALKHLADD